MELSSFGVFGCRSFFFLCFVHQSPCSFLIFSLHFDLVVNILFFYNYYSGRSSTNTISVFTIQFHFFNLPHFFRSLFRYVYFVTKNGVMTACRMCWDCLTKAASLHKRIWTVIRRILSTHTQSSRIFILGFKLSGDSVDCRVLRDRWIHHRSRETLRRPTMPNGALCGLWPKGRRLFNKCQIFALFREYRPEMCRPIGFSSAPLPVREGGGLTAGSLWKVTSDPSPQK